MTSLFSPGLTYLNGILTVLNTLTFQEYVSLKSTLIATENNRFNCDYCLNQKYQGNPKKTEIERKLLGCDDRAPVPHKIEGLIFHRCPGNFVSHQASAWLESYFMFDKGVMPFNGGYFSQPTKSLEIMRVIGNFRLQKQVERAKKAELKQRGAQRGRKRS